MFCISIFDDGRHKKMKSSAVSHSAAFCCWHDHLAFLRRKNDFFFHFLRFHITAITLQYAGVLLPVRWICGV